MASKTKTVRELKLSAVITKEGPEYVALCPELDIASQGDTIEESLKMLKEAVELYIEDQPEIRIPETHSFVTTFEVEAHA